jgi:hypothetical protein
MSKIFDVAFKDGYEYAQNFVNNTFSSYKEAKRWARLTLQDENPKKLAYEDIGLYGLCIDWMSRGNVVPDWWNKENNVMLLTEYYAGKFEFCRLLVRGRLRCSFTRQ